MNRNVAWLKSTLAILVGISSAISQSLPRVVSATPKVSPVILSPLPRTAFSEIVALPPAFSPNQGQSDPSVKFLSRGKGYGLFLTQDEAVLVLAHKSATMGASLTEDPVVTRMRLRGTRPDATPEGIERLRGLENYFRGNNPTRWRTSVPTYAKVRYRELYPGVDLLYYSRQNALEFDFVVAPAADVSSIRFDFPASTELAIAANGDLTVRTAETAMTLRRPQLYQTIAGSLKTIEGKFQVLPENVVGFAVGPYDHSHELVIDPVLSYSTYLGGTGADSANAIAVDTEGNVYVAGETSSVDFPVTHGAYQASNHAIRNSTTNAFVAKLNPTGTALIFSTYLGGTGISGNTGDFASSMAIDLAGNVYLTGSSYSMDFPVTPDALQPVNRAAANGERNAFVTKLSADGTALIYSTYIGGSAGDWATGLALDSSGDAFISGGTNSIDFPVTAGAYRTSSSGTYAFAAKLSPNGTSLAYATYLGPIANSNGQGNSTAIAVDRAGNAYIAGSTASPDYPVTADVFQTTNRAAPNDLDNVFITKLNPGGAALIYSTFLGGTDSQCCVGDIAEALALDAAGNVYVTGSAQSSDFPVTPGAFQTTNNGAPNTVSNAFVTKLNTSGTALIYSTYLGGSGGLLHPTHSAYLVGDQGTALSVDSSGNAYVAGVTASSDFPTTADAYQPINNSEFGVGGNNGFIAKLNSSATALEYSTFVGGSSTNVNARQTTPIYGDQVNGITTDASGKIYVAGSAQSGDFPVTLGSFESSLNSPIESAFIAKFDLSQSSTAIAPTVTVNPTADSIPSAQPTTIDVSVAGGSTNPSGVVILTSAGYSSKPATLIAGSATIEVPAGSLVAEPAIFFLPDLLLVNYIPDASSSPSYTFASGVGSVEVVAAYVNVTPSISELTWAQSQSEATNVAINVIGGSGNPAPTGTVDLTTGSYTSSSATLSSGNATIIVPPKTLTTGFNTLTVNYSGDKNYAGDMGAGLVAVGSVTVTVMPASTTVYASESLAVEITVDPGSGNPPVTGSVRLASGSYGSSAVTLVAGSATITIPAGVLAPGTDLLTARYGDGNYPGANATASVTVLAAEPGFAITGTAITISQGATSGNTSSITVTPSGGFTGTVALSATVLASPAGAQSAPTFSFGSGNTVNITTAASASATLTVATTEENGCTAASRSNLHSPWSLIYAVIFPGLLLCSVVPWRKVAAIGASLALGVVLVLMPGCGGDSHVSVPCSGQTSGTTPGTYTINVVGTSGQTTASGTISLVIK